MSFSLLAVSGHSTPIMSVVIIAFLPRKVNGVLSGVYRKEIRADANTRRENAPSWAHLHLHAVLFVNLRRGQNIGRILRERRVALMLHFTFGGGGGGRLPYVA